MKNVFNTLEERGFIKQSTGREPLINLLQNLTVCYIGFDPTANSFHVGNLLPIMSLIHMQRANHRSIIIIGGGTSLIGDPSGKTKTRSIMTPEEINENTEALGKQLSRFIDFDWRATIINNADWLTKLNYIGFLRDIGRYFSVNKMLAAESYKTRLETGLNFIEFNYMLLQAYDFLHLFRYYNCRLQMGGNDQWGNILAGVDLIKRVENKTVCGLTFPLMTTSSGIKMGKTHKGTIWLDPKLTSPYEYYQYWINQDDPDIEQFLSLFTLLPMDEIKQLGSLKGADIREAKEILAYEATKICHGQEEADQARKAAQELFWENKSMSSHSIPNYNAIENDIPAYILFEMTGLCKTRGEARRLITQGGGYFNRHKITSFDQIINLKGAENILRAGKKRYMNVTLVK